MDLIKMFVSGIIVVGIVAAVGINAQGLAAVAKQGGKTGAGLLNTAETGNPLWI